MKDGYSLVVTSLSIPSSATCRLDADLSSNEGSKEILKDSDDGPTIKKRVSDSNKEDNNEHEIEAMGTYPLHFLGFLSQPLSLRSLLFFFIYIYIYIYLHNFMVHYLFILPVHSFNHRYS